MYHRSVLYNGCTTTQMSHGQLEDMYTNGQLAGHLYTGNHALDMSGYRDFGGISGPSMSEVHCIVRTNVSHPLQSPEGQKVLKRGANDYKRHIERGIGSPYHTRFASRLVALTAFHTFSAHASASTATHTAYGRASKVQKVCIKSQRQNARPSEVLLKVPASRPYMWHREYF